MIEINLKKVQQLTTEIQLIDFETASNFFCDIANNITNAPSNTKDKVLILITGGIATGKSLLSYNVIRFFELQNIPYVSSDTFFKLYYSNLDFDIGYEKARQHTDNLLRELLSQQASFVWETILSKNKKRLFLEECKQAGYKIICFYVGTQNSNITYNRSDSRVYKGNHFVDHNFIDDRYSKSLESLNWMLHIADISVIIDNTCFPQLVFYKSDNEIFKTDLNISWLKSYI